MSFEMRQFFSGLKGYMPVATSPDGEQLQGPQSFKDCLMQYMKSKRVRMISIITIILVVGTFATYHYGSGIGFAIPKPSAPAECPPTADSVDWSRFAYVQYVTNSAYLCNSLMIFESLHRLGSRAEKVMMYPRDWSADASSTSSDSYLLRKARDEYGVHLQPIEIQQKSSDPTWGASFTKLLAFNQTQYDRVLSLDSDATVLQTMDELFLIPPAPVAMPRAYWLNPDDRVLSSQLVLLEPSKFEFDRIQAAMEHKQSKDFDMEIVNDLYKDNCFIVPHRPYDLLSGEFRNEPNEHKKYLGSDEEKWDAKKVIEEAKFLHFSDWPYPKPWIDPGQGSTDQRKPQCHDGDCSDQEIWLWLYTDFRSRRDKVCKMAPMPDRA